MLHVDNLYLRAGDFSVESVSFKIDPGEYYFLLGESGSGKSLILEAITGIRKIQKGSIFIDNRNITEQPVNRRDVGIVFQNLAIFPHKTVFQNIAFSLKQRNWGRKEIEKEVHEIAQRLSIDHLLERYPGSLSGGEHQRVALARTLIMKPRVLLLDEPLTSLDMLLKEDMVELLKEIHGLGQTILHVTHDYHVVSELADRISIIENGRIVQTGTKEEIISAPRCRLAEKINHLSIVKNEKI
jgi:ABC-type sugar transport system ATPase subunit